MMLSPCIQIMLHEITAGFLIIYIYSDTKPFTNHIIFKICTRYIIYHGVYMEVGALRHLIMTSTRIPKINMLPLLSEQFNFKPKCIPLIVVGGGCTGMGINTSEKNHNPCSLFDNKFELHVIADNICT